MEAIPAPEDTCALEDLQHSTNKLPYQILSIAQQDALLSCQRLTSTTKLIWQYLHNHADYHSRKVVYNLQRMAHFFKVSTKTIKRGIEQLIKHKWIKATQYSKQHGGIEEIQVLMPQTVFEDIIQGNHRKEGPLNYENRERHYCKDWNGNILFTYYINPNGTKTIVLDESLSLDEITKMLQSNIVHGPAANDAYDYQQALEHNNNNHNVVPLHEIPAESATPTQHPTSEPTTLSIDAIQYEQRLTTELKETWDKSISPDYSSNEKYEFILHTRSLSSMLNDFNKVKPHPHLAHEFVSLEEKLQIDNLSKDERNKLFNQKTELVRTANKLTADLEKTTNNNQSQDKSVPIPIIKFKSQITSSSNLSTSSKNRFFAIAKESGKDNAPIRYSTTTPIHIPKQYTEKVKEAIATLKSQVTDPQGLYKEMIWAISRQFVGKPKDRPNATRNDIMRFNTDVAIKLIRENRWRMPSGFIPKEILTAQKQAEQDKEKALRNSIRVPNQVFFKLGSTEIHISPDNQVILQTT